MTGATGGGRGRRVRARRERTRGHSRGRSRQPGPGRQDRRHRPPAATPHEPGHARPAPPPGRRRVRGRTAVPRRGRAGAGGPHLRARHRRHPAVSGVGPHGRGAGQRGATCCATTTARSAPSTRPPTSGRRPRRRAFAGELVSHNDPNLDNIVFRDGRAVALIDFDLASPGSRVWDVACAARLWAPLRPDRYIDDARRGRALARFRLFVDSYGLGRARPPSAGGRGAPEPRVVLRRRRCRGCERPRRLLRLLERAPWSERRRPASGISTAPTS